MKKKLLSIILVMAMVITLVPAFGVVAYAANPGNGTSENPYLVSDATDLANAVSSGGSIKLTSDIAIDTTLTVASGKTVELDLNGCVLKETANTSVITNAGTLTIIDSGYNTTVHYYTISSSGIWVWDDTHTTSAEALSYYEASPSAITQGAVVAISGGAITGGKTNSGYPAGGVLNGNGGTVQILGGTIIGNEAGQSGGGLYNLGDMTISGGAIIGNVAQGYGGGVHNFSSTITMSGVTILGNKANNGGGVSNNGTATMNDVTIVGNNATEKGGGVYNMCTTTMSGVTISNNIASYGGGVNNSDNGTMTILGGTISGNKASSNGGGVNNTGSVTIIGGTIVGNEAPTNGGGVFNGINSSLAVSGVTLSENQAGDGGGVFNLGITTMSGVTIQDNSSQNSGGGVFNYLSSSKLIISGGSIIGNKAQNYYGGGVRNAGTTTMSGVTITGNSADLGAGVYHSSGNMSISGGAIMENHASTKSGGVHCFSAAEISGGLLIRDNHVGATLSNLYIIKQIMLDVGALFEDASIGISLIENSLFTTGEFSTTGAEYTHFNFFSDNSAYHVETSGAGLKIAEGERCTIAVVTSGSGTVNHSKLYNIPSGASITSSGSIITVGGVTVTASALNGNKFAKWEVSPNNNTVTANTTITAVFEAIPDVKYTVSIGHSVFGGTVSQASVPNVVSGTSVSFSANYLYIGNVSVTAIASTGYEFSSWEGIPSSGKITANTTIDAVFVPKNDDGGNDGGTYIVVPDINKEDKKEEKKEDKKDEPKAAEQFTDVVEGAYYYEAVNWAVENGITEGIGDGQFAPNAITSRAEMITFLWRAAGKPIVNTGTSFTDVPAGSYYADAVNWAVANGITNGTSATTFGSGENVTRAQTVVFLWRYEGSAKASAGGSFSDVDAGSYYADAVSWAKEQAITTGTDAGVFNPKASCTRGQIVTFLYRDFAE